MTKEISSHLPKTIEHQYFGDSAPGSLTHGAEVVKQDTEVGQKSLKELCDVEKCIGRVSILVVREPSEIFDPGLFIRRIACQISEDECALAVIPASDIITQVALAPSRDATE